MALPLKSLEVINSADRISSVDIFRSLAIISVVLYHFNESLPFGFLGVDLFFLISGLLVGGLLTKDFKNGKEVHFLKFFLQRGFKIWPSYYFFLALGTVFALCLYQKTNPDQVIPLWDLKRYLLFYLNYTGSPPHWSFDHLWSLCIEEHFYILLPILFLIVCHLIKKEYRTKALFIFVILTILAGIVFKPLSYYLTTGQDTYSGTQNRIDALAWGVLLNLIISYSGDKLRSLRFRFIALALGTVILVTSLWLSASGGFVLFNKLYFHSLVPLAFFFLILGSYHVDFSKLRTLRFIAYYSYNWYLWHPIFVIYITKQLGNTIQGMLTYLLVTFLMAVFSTILVEETFMAKRKFVLDKIFNRVKGSSVSG